MPLHPSKLNASKLFDLFRGLKLTISEHSVRSRRFKFGKEAIGDKSLTPVQPAISNRLRLPSWLNACTLVTPLSPLNINV